MNKIRIGILCCLLWAGAGCKKQDAWLNAKSTKSDVLLSTLKDYQALMDNDNVMNAGYPALGIVGADNYYIDYSFWQSLFNAQERNGYIWAADIFGTEPSYDWANAYSAVAYANIALAGLQDITPAAGEENSYNNIKGSALFYRAFGFFNVAQLFARTYDAATAAADPGIPLRLSSEVAAAASRSTVAAVYAQILADLRAAAALLPQHPQYQTRPSQAAAYALLARTFLNMAQYDSAGAYAEKALAQYSALLDFNALDTTSADPLPPFPGNNEVIFYAVSNSFYILFRNYLKVDTTLYSLYAPGDLRRTVFYDAGSPEGIYCKSDYTGTTESTKFCGLATNELLLIKAECAARLGNTAAALQALNTLLAKRYRTGSFVPVIGTDAEEILGLVLTERRKELPFTGDLRWQDLRRLNKDPQFAVTLRRVLNGQEYTLPPNDNRYVYPLPPDEIKLSGLAQNPR
ncbi:RagB/SusD family nutrient uptake outer membrane protein [Ilyomonas limi]|uniref:RagB/SusD family nutrient uptake outer membrane protein n=1 Tax=Ilyomonas limi TaxID=2575867 RepID=A0A4V5UTD6_9BACT|nr:RagB/SusD family nutrient uptake outer membrane protein [Ilyomonas limi]TKK64363.1 RagB/SusD family nutrient uptake outer membrane protein [Ilyomonas limi]